MMRSEWTPAERLQVRGVFGPEHEAEALDLFAPDDWEEFCEAVPAGELVAVLYAERAALRRKRLRWAAGREMGFSPPEIALAGARVLYEIHAEGASA